MFKRNQNITAPPAQRGIGEQAKASKQALLALAALALTACTTFNKPTLLEVQFCSALDDWINAGPRDGHTTRDITFYRPSRSEEVGFITITSLGYESSCEDCWDAADTLLRQAAFKSAHYWWIHHYATYSAACVDASPEPIVDLSNDDQGDVLSMKQAQQKQIGISWKRSDCGFEGCTRIEVEYTK